MTATEKTIPEPSLSDLLAALRKQIFLQLNCHAIGIVDSFNPQNQTVKATIAYKRKFSTRQQDGKYRSELQDYPILIDCPCIILGGGDSGITFPIQSGDECLLLFNDRSIDEWFSSGQVGEVKSLRLHSMSDAIALVGLKSEANSLTDYETDKVKVFKGDTQITLGDKISVQNSSQSLVDLLKALIDEIKLITVTCAAPGSPSGTPLNAAQLTVLATQIEELLE